MRHRALTALTIGLTAGTVLAQQVQPFFLLEKGPGSEWIVSEKDQGLRRALAMLPDRIGELPVEIDHLPPPALDAMRIAAQVFAQPATFAMTYNPGDARGMGYGISFSLGAANEAEAQRMHGLLLQGVAQAPMPFALQDHPQRQGMKQIVTPFGPISFGPAAAGESWSWQLLAGATDDPRFAFDRLPQAPAGFAPYLRARLDFAALQAAAQMGQGFVGNQPMGNQVFEQLRQMGIVGEDTISVDYLAGYADDATVELTTVHNARGHAGALGLSTTPLTRRHLRAIPEDAVMAAIGTFDREQFDKVLDQLSSQGVPVEEGLGEFHRHTGVDLMNDVVASLGDAGAIYTSDGTGGGSIASAVLLIGVSDRQRLADAHEKLASLANRAILDAREEMVSSYLRVEPWTAGGHQLYSIRFRGLPVPAEISWAITDDWLVLGLTPQAVIAAAQQAAGDGVRPLAATETFASLDFDGGQITSLVYADADRLGRSGYPLLSMLGSALANAVRSPTEIREPGLVVPTFRDLMAGARPMAQVSYWDGDSFVTEGRADRSLLVQGAVGLGAVAQVAPLAMGIAAPAIMGAREHHRWGLLDGVQHPELAIRRLGDALHLDPLERAAVAIALAWKANPEAFAAEPSRAARD